MRRLLFALFLFPQLCHAQKITREIEPGNHAVWLATDQFTLKPGYVVLNFRTINGTIFIYVLGQGVPIGPHDYAAFILDQDTVTAYSTALQFGANNGMTTAVLSLHEYVISLDDLRKLSKRPVKKVVISDFSGFEYTDVPARNQDKLMTWSAALLNAMGN